MAKKKQRVITIAATKGGVGKTTVTALLAVRACQEGRVALIDADSRQGSLLEWWFLRKEPTNPNLLRVDLSGEGLGLIGSDGWDWMLIDTPPAIIDAISPAIAIADLVIIPVRPSTIDTLAVAHTIELCVEMSKPYVFLLNALNPRGQFNDNFRRALRAKGDLLEAEIRHRETHVNAMMVGKTAPEIEGGARVCRAEAEALWSEIKARVG
jgi:chromosome partitioning protein